MTGLMLPVPAAVTCDTFYHHKLHIKGSFTLKEDDPSARVILEVSFGLHAKMLHLGSTFHLVYMQDHPSAFVFIAVAKQDGGRQ